MPGAVRFGRKVWTDQRQSGRSLVVLALALGLASSLAWGTGDFFGGIQAKRLHGIVVVAVSQGFALAALGSAFLLSSELGLTLSREVCLIAAGAGLCGALGLASLYQALAVGTMGIVAPVAALGVLVPVIAGAVSGERPTSLQVLGMAAALTGTLVATRASHGAAHETPDSTRGLGSAVGAALLFGTAMVGLDHAADSDPVETVLVARIASVTILSIVIALIGLTVAGTRTSLPVLAGIGLLDLAAVLLFAVASTEGLLSIVAIAGSLAPVVTAALAAAILDERLARAQVVGVALALGGIVCMGVG